MPARCPPPSTSAVSASLPRSRRVFPSVRPPPSAAQPHAGSGLAFFLFILVNVVLFIRPAEINPVLQDLPIYQVAILICLAFSIPSLAVFFKRHSLAGQPITVCVLLLLPAVVLSHLSHLNFYSARADGFEFLKVEIYFLLLLANISSAARLRQFMICLVGLIGLMTILSLLQYHGLIHITAIEAMAQREILEEVEFYTQRLQGTGLFNDPNDFCLILVVGMTISAYWLTDRGLGLFRIVPLIMLGLFGQALALTHSRGGLLAFLACLIVLIYCRFGWKKTFILAALVLPLLFLAFGGRQTRFNLADPEDTAQTRFEFWSDSLQLLKQAPLFGIGTGGLVDEIYHVAHNSFVHAFAELGLFGGMLFLGVFFTAALTLNRLGSPGIQIVDPRLKHLRPFLLAMTVGFAAGIFSLSRCYTVTTYFVPGLVSSFVAVAPTSPPVPVLRFDLHWLKRLAVVGLLFIFAVYLFVRFAVH
jgi:O-antigen ligase